MNTIVWAGIAMLAAVPVISPAGEPARPHIAGIAHMAIYVHDMEKSRAFYHDFLGYEEPYSSRQSGRKLVHDFFQGERSPIPRSLPGKSSWHGPAEPHLDRDRRCRGPSPLPGGEGRESSRKGRRGPYQEQNFNITDPDGHTVEIVQYMPDGWTVREKGKSMPDRVSTG